MNITRCKTNRLVNPLGFELFPLRLTWTVEDTESIKQTAARVEVSTDEGFLNLIHDSGRSAEVDSLGYTPDIELSARTRYYWRVTVWGDCGDHAVSRVNWFESGKMGEAFTGCFISPDLGDRDVHPYMRRSFSVSGKTMGVRVYATGRGLYELYINGARVGDEYLAPGCNAYDKWLQVQAYDVTALLREGANCIGAMLGNGWAKGRFGVRSHFNNYCDEYAFLCELRIAYAGGGDAVIHTDGSWKCARSPILADGIYDGEVYNANKAIHGWSLPGFDDSGWRPCKTAPPAPGKLSDRLSPPVRIIEELQPVRLLCTPDSETVLDMGQNMVGFLRFHADVPKGTELTLRFGEILQNGCFYRQNLRSAQQAYHYISDGTAAKAQPHFTFFGFRYVKLEGFPPDIDLHDFTGCVLHTQMERTGFIETSDADVNRLFNNVIWGQKGNFIDVPTDCPQRDERLGWTGDAQVFCETAAWNMDVYAFFTKFLRDMAEEQNGAGGLVPQVVPDIYPKDGKHTGLGGGSAGWGDAAAVIPWMLYRHYGDAAILTRQFDSMRAWVDWLRAQDIASGGSGLFMSGQQVGDWLSFDAPDPLSRFGGTDIQYIYAAYYRYSAMLVAKAAAALGRDDLHREYAELSEKVRGAIQTEYFTPSGRCAIRTQTALAMALYMDLVADEFRQKTLEDLKNLLLQDKLSLKTGFLGTPLICRVLSEGGAHDIACRIFFNRNMPGWLYQVDMGATTVWERWNSVLPDGAMSEDGMNSLNHYAYGSIAAWMYGCLCGLSPDEDAPGFRHYTVRPMPCKQVSFARAEFLSPLGRMTCGWRREVDGSITVTAGVPFGAEATLVLYDGAEPVRLAAGLHTISYLPEKPAGYPDRPLGILLADSTAAAIISEMIPILMESPGDLLSLSIREIQKSGRMELFAPAECFDRLAGMLETLET